MKKAHFIKLVILIYFICICSSNALDFRYWNYTNSPLPRFDIHSLAVDSTGKIWLSAWSQGTFKTDTYLWQNYKLIDNSINIIGSPGIIVDQKDNKWLGSFKGLVRFNGSVWDNYNDTNSSIPFLNVEPIFLDKENNLWMKFRTYINFNGYIKFNGSSDWQVFDKSNSGLLDSIVYTMAQDFDGSFWFSTRKGVVKFDGKNWQTIFKENKSPYDSIVLSICFAPDGSKYFGTPIGLLILKESKWKLIDTSNSNILKNYVLTITIDKKNNIWVATEAGLAKYDSLGFHYIKHSFDDGNINNVYETVVDKYNNKWFFVVHGYVNPTTSLVVYNEDGLQGINGIEENFIDRDETQMIFPNPASDFIEISVGANGPSPLQSDVRIYDVLGQTVSFVRAGLEPATTIRIDVSGLAPGMYFVRIGDRVGKFVKL